MKKNTFEEIPFYNYELKELLKDLRSKISKYNGEYNNKEFKEYLEALLMLDIDILKDNTYSEAQIEKYKKIDIYRRLINFNVYGSMRKFLSTIDETIVWPSRVYTEDKTYYLAWHDGERILDIDLDNKKPIISLETLVESKKIRYTQAKKKIDVLYKKSKIIKENSYQKEKHYCDLMDMINEIKDLLTRKELDEEQINTQKYLDWVYKKIEEKYGPFEKNNDKEENIETNNAIITGTSIVKETPIATFQKRKIYY